MVQWFICSIVTMNPETQTSNSDILQLQNYLYFHSMKKLFSAKSVVITVFLVFSCLIVWVWIPEEKIDYNSQVKPILNKHCISCHGGVKQNGGFSLLFEAEAKGNTDSGAPAIIAGHPNRSEMIRRLTSNDPEERMPYEKDPLSKEEIDILKKWIDQGAVWDTHWSYLPVQKQVVTDRFSKDKEYQDWRKNDIDYFIYEKLHEFHLKPSPPASDAIFKRRLAYDLTGLPVSGIFPDRRMEEVAEMDIEQFVDALLESPHFGEKWAGMWMDLARYADTKGYERDDARTIWKYRDWLIKAFNHDMPYDQFLVEQIAGDLLPNATDDQLIATAFHRNTMTNDEGGTENEEFRVAAVVDRVNTTWEVTMGTTFACVQCHSHPYDPFTMKEYYKYMAFFNNTRDEDTFDDYPVFRHFEGEDSLKFKELTRWLNDHADDERRNEITKFLKTWQPTINSLTSDEFLNSELADTKWLVFRNHGTSRLKKVNLDGKNTLIYRYRSVAPGGWWKINLDSLNGSLLLKEVVRDTERKWMIAEINFEEIEGTHDLYFNYENPNLKNPEANGLMFDWFYFTENFPGQHADGYAEARDSFIKLTSANTLQTPIMQENPPEMMRETRIFERGNWLTPTELVNPGVPGIFNSLPEGEALARLKMAYWLTDVKNPLTARTYVNRIWEQLFGVGIVETLEDFGSQGIPPTHEALLDHLSWKFMHEFQWSTKALLKYIVASATYQQSSKSNHEHLAVDPQNRYYARGPRVRLNAEQVRDQALVVSGLFNPKMYGPGVMPYQPEGIWNSPYSSRKWVQSEGEEQYRRAIYTYWKRTSPYPSMLIFDAMAREVCSSRRISTNTPLQALVTLNDSAYVETAIHFGRRMSKEGGSQLEDQIRYGYQLMLNRDISEEKLAILIKLYYEMSDETPLFKNVSAHSSQTASQDHEKAMTIVASAMLNLDEFLMKN